MTLLAEMICRGEQVVLSPAKHPRLECLVQCRLRTEMWKVEGEQQASETAKPRCVRWWEEYLLIGVA